MSSQYIPYSSRGGGSGGSGGVSSINGETGAITITGAGGTTVTNVGDAFTITSSNTTPTEYNDGNLGSAATIDWNNGVLQTGTLNSANCTITLANGTYGFYTLRLQQDATGGRTVTWPSNVFWPSNTAPTLSGANKQDLIGFYGYQVSSVQYYLGFYNDNYNIGASAFSPLSVSGIQLWLDGNDILNGSNPTSGTKFATWDDKSGNARNYSQGTSAQQFTSLASAVNSNNAASLPSSPVTFMQAPTNFLTAGQAVSIWSVFERAGSGAIPQSTIWADDGPGGTGNTALQVTGSTITLYTPGSTFTSMQWTAPSLVNGTPYLLTFMYNGGSTSVPSNFTVLINGTACAYASNPGPAYGAASGTFIGGDGLTGDAGLYGFFCEHVIYNNIPSSGDQTSLNNYFNTKWGT